MLRYYRTIEGDRINWREPISYEEALEIVIGTYKDNDMSRDMLTIPNYIQCNDCRIGVEEVDDQGRVRVLMAGYYNCLPMDVEYDDNGNRVEEA